jgi:tRNA A-37 threonylcarbamoyl transferase component Bud32
MTDSPSTLFPRLRLRHTIGSLLDLPWELPLADWEAAVVQFRELRVGPSRHLVRFVVDAGRLVALKEEPLWVAQREYQVLRHVETLELPAVLALGIAESPERDSAILVTEYLAHSMQYRRMLARFPLGAGEYRDRLLDAMAWLLVDLHRAGVYWGDCSLANTLFRRDGDRIQAYLVDAETSEVHPSLSDGQRAHDLEVLVENVAFGLADVDAEAGRDVDAEEAIRAAESVRERYLAVWAKLHETPALHAGDRHAIRARVRKLNELGFTVEELSLEPGVEGHKVRLDVAVTTRRFHARELERLTGLHALEGQARILVDDVREYGAWLEWAEGRSIAQLGVGARWRREVFEPTVGRIRTAVGPGRDLVQAYCDVLEHKWLLSERAGTDVGLEAAIAAYLEAGAPAPERPADGGFDGTVAAAVDTIRA